MNIFKVIINLLLPKIVIKSNVDLVRYQAKLFNLKTNLELIGPNVNSYFLTHCKLKIANIEKAIDEYKVKIGGEELQSLRSQIKIHKNRVAEIAKTKSLQNYQRSISELEKQVPYLENAPLILSGYTELLSAIEDK